jgi:ribosomal protein S18 acetylase RimI-like enzyme
VTPDVQISDGDADQIDRLRPVFLTLHDHHRAFSAVALTEPAERAWTERASTYAEYFVSGRALLHLATHREQCVGYALTVVHDTNDDTFPMAPRYAELYTLAVLPEWRGSGLGSRLMDAVDAALQDAGIPNLTVAVMAGNNDAVRFYQRRGLVPGEIMLYRLGDRTRVEPG